MTKAVAISTAVRAPNEKAVCPTMFITHKTTKTFGICSQKRTRISDTKSRLSAGSSPAHMPDSRIDPAVWHVGGAGSRTQAAFRIRYPGALLRTDSECLRRFVGDEHRGADRFFVRCSHGRGDGDRFGHLHPRGSLLRPNGAQTVRGRHVSVLHSFSGSTLLQPQPAFA